MSMVGVLALAAFATAKSNIPEGRGVESGEVNVITASVVGIDKEDRTLTLRGPQGNVVTVEVPDEVRNFDQLEVGDTVKAPYSLPAWIRQASGGRKVTFNPNGEAIFSSVARVGFPVPFWNSERIRGEMAAIFFAKSFWVMPRIFGIRRVVSRMSISPLARPR